MSKLRINCFSLSLDGFGAGLNQSLENPMGVNAMGIHGWVFPTKSFQEMHGNEKAGGESGIDDDFMKKGFENVGAWILGRNMFGPIRGPWTDEEWKGWWGDNPPYHCPVFVLTNHARAPIVMEGGTTFYFVTDGIHSALKQAKEAAGNKDVRLGGGVSTIRQFLMEKLVDEIHLAISPVVLGIGENLFSGLDLIELGYESVEHKTTPAALHIVLNRKK